MVDLGGATTGWFPAGEWREGEREGHWFTREKEVLCGDIFLETMIFSAID
jgi:hypothetical protein